VTADASVFYCPSGVKDIVGTQYSVPPRAKPFPATRTDSLGARPWRTQSATTGIIVDTWYGINADWNDSDKYFAPAHFQPYANSHKDYAYPKLGSIRYSAEMVFMFDGIFYNLAYSSSPGGANRINARHNREKQTNVLFYDGHAATHDIMDIPGGRGDANQPSNPFTVTNLQNWRAMRWRTDQP
jgi:prepilin-type processing-associated H-X9-DG protein